MALMAATKEENSRRRSINILNDAPEVRCVKRRRRDAAALAVDYKNEPIQRCDLASPTTMKRSSKFRGVSRHRWTGRYEAHLWDKLSWNVTQKKKGKQVYLGAYDEEESAARAYDLAALKYWGPTTLTNFPVSEYEKEIEIMQTLTKEEYLASLRRKSSGFSRGVSKYRGVARHHHNGRWEARIGRVFGNKYLYLGTYSTQEEAARAYDIAAIEYRGINAVTNFELSTYIRWLKPGTETQPLNQESQTSIESNIMPSNTYSWFEEPMPPFLDSRIYISDDVRSYEKQTLNEAKLPVSPSTKSSPTALGLLLRSSMFRELLEKNVHSSDEEDEGEDMKKQLVVPYNGTDDQGDFNFTMIFEEIYLNQHIQ